LYWWFYHSYRAREHKLGKYRKMWWWITSINIIIHHFTWNWNQRSTSEKDPINVKILCLSIPAEAKRSEN
jgi:hypothetical protein